MPMSDEAAGGLRAAVEWNPFGAYGLLAILRETPAWVRYKPDDRYGPLGFILFGVPPRKPIARGVSVPVKSPPFPEERLAECEVFGREWLERRFTKRELADAIEGLLVAVVDSRPEWRRDGAPDHAGRERGEA